MFFSGSDTSEKSSVQSSLLRDAKAILQEVNGAGWKENYAIHNLAQQKRL